jgi:hypothetical protein
MPAVAGSVKGYSPSAECWIWRRMAGLSTIVAGFVRNRLCCFATSLAGREWRLPAGGRGIIRNARLRAVCGQKLRVWRGIAAAKMPANRIEFAPLILA